MSKEELEKLYTDESKRLLSLIRSKIGNNIDIHEDADILQDVFFATLNGIDISKPMDNLAGYIYTAIRNKLIDLFRKKRLGVVDGVSIDDISFDETLSEQFENERERNLLFAAIMQLTEAEQQVIIQTEFEGYSFKELAQKTATPINTLLSRKRYAIKKLRTLINKENL